MARKHRGVYERTPGSGVFCIEYMDENGKRRRKTVGTEAEAIEAAEYMRSRTRLAKIAPELVQEQGPQKTLDDVMGFCAETKRLKKKTKKLHEVYRRTWNRAFPGALLSDITAEKIERWVSKRMEKNTYRGKPPSPATINRDLAYLKMVFNVAIKHDWAKKNPVVLIEKLPENNQDDFFYSPEQMQAILDRQGYTQAVITEIAVQTGMRLDEQFSLELKDLNLELGLVRLEDPKAGRKQWVELNDRAIELFREVLSSHKDPQWVFPSFVGRHRGRPMSGRYFSENHFLPVLEELGLPGRWHTLRHTFGSWLRMAGVDLANIRDLMRHSEQAVTERYAHIGNLERKKAVNQIGKIFSKRSPHENQIPRLMLVK